MAQRQLVVKSSPAEAKSGIPVAEPNLSNYRLMTSPSGEECWVKVDRPEEKIDSFHASSSTIPMGSDVPHHRALTVPVNMAIPDSIGLKSYQIRLTRVADISSSGAGVVLLATQVGILSNYAQGSSYSGLFSEFRVLSSKITYIRNDQTSAGSVLPRIMYSAFDPINIGAAPSAGASPRLLGCKIYNGNATTPVVCTNEYTFKPKRPYSNVLSSGTAVDPLGSAGSWLHETSVTTVASLNVLTYMIETWFDFRSSR